VRHADAPGTGCVLAALAPELARKPLAVRQRIEALQGLLPTGMRDRGICPGLQS
jgi:hypothetical protein